MERKVLAACSIGLMVFASHVLAGGGGTGANVGATEFTQLKNNAELIAQVAEAMETTANTMRTAYATMQSIKNLPAIVINKIAGPQLEQVARLAEAYRKLREAVLIYRDAADVLSKAHKDALRLNITPSQLLHYKAEAAYRYGGVYRTAYEQEMEKLKRLDQMSKEVQKQAETIQTIDANVSGIQFIATQNLAMQKMLADLNESIQKANALAFHEASRRKEEEARMAERDAKFDEKFRSAQEHSDQIVKSFDTSNILPDLKKNR